MSSSTMREEQDTVVSSSSNNSGLNILLHPLPLLNISEHYNRARLSSGDKDVKWTQSNRDISIVNSFELILTPSTGSTTSTGSTIEGNQEQERNAVATANVGVPGDIDMDGTTYGIDLEFFETRQSQFKAVFPTQEVVGWYTISTRPTHEDIVLHQQFAQLIDNPIFALFDTDHPPTSQDLPIRVFESSLDEPLNPSSSSSSESRSKNGKFVELEYGVESGEAERIAVDGVSKGGMGENDESAAVGNLVTQRNAIRMLYERITVLSDYIQAIAEKRVQPDHQILRQISSLVATLPTIDAKQFKEELVTEHEDVEITTYLANLTKQISALSAYSDRHYALHPSASQFEDFGMNVQRGFKGRRR